MSAFGFNVLRAVSAPRFVPTQLSSLFSTASFEPAPDQEGDFARHLRELVRKGNGVPYALSDDDVVARFPGRRCGTSVRHLEEPPKKRSRSSITMDANQA